MLAVIHGVLESETEIGTLILVVLASLSIVVTPQELYRWYRKTWTRVEAWGAKRGY